MKIFVAAAAIGISVLSISAANAGTTCVGATLNNGILPNSGCETGSTNNDDLGMPPIQVNIDSMFSFTDWAFIAKDNDLNGTDEGDASALTITGGLQSGSWSISQAVFDMYSDVMLVQKGGQGNTTQPTYVGWLVSTLTGSYDTVFLNPNNNNGKEISHITLYARGDGNPGPGPDPIPLPAAAWLLLSGAGALGALRLKRKG